MSTYYLISSHSRSVNSIRDGNDNIETFYLTKQNPADNKNFDRWADTSESVITEIEADNDQQANELFHVYMQEHYDCTNAFDKDKFDDYCSDAENIACITLGSAPIDNDFYRIEDPDGVTDNNAGIYPDIKDGVVMLWGLDNGSYDRVNQCEWFNDFLKIPAFVDYLKTLVDIDDEDEYEDDYDFWGNFDWDSEIDWKSIDIDTDEMNSIIDILEHSGYSTEIAVSPGHLDSSSPAGCGEGAVFSYIFIKKTS